MAFENVDVSLARSSLNNCLNTLSHDASLHVITGVKDNNIWNAAARNILLEALNKLFTTKYTNLETKIKTYLDVINKIEQYKTAQTSLKNTESKIKQTQINLNNEKQKKKQYERKGSEYSAQLNRINQNIAFFNNQLNKYNTEKTNYQSKMTSLKISIDLLMNQ